MVVGVQRVLSMERCMSHRETKCALLLDCTSALNSDYSMFQAVPLDRHVIVFHPYFSAIMT